MQSRFFAFNSHDNEEQMEMQKGLYKSYIARKEKAVLIA